MAAAIAAAAVVGQLVEGNIKFLNVVQDVAPSTEEAMTGLSGFNTVKQRIHGSSLVTSERQERCPVRITP